MNQLLRTTMTAVVAVLLWQTSAAAHAASGSPGAPSVVIVDKAHHFTLVYQLLGGRVTKVFQARNAIGKASTPTPFGTYHIVAKKMYPSWTPPVSIDPRQVTIPPYNETHRNPLGVASILLDRLRINLHGTNSPGSIGRSVSHGCVRHSNADILRIYSLVEPGDRVIITSGRATPTLADFG